MQIGGGAPISVQTMANADPHDAGALLRQTEACAALGCDIMRLAVPDREAAATFAEVARRSPLPLVADIHFDYRLAIAAVDAGASALRLNPGNIGGRENVEAVARAAKARGVPVRIGVNLGSLESDLAGRLADGGRSPERVAEALCESATRNLAVLEGAGFGDVVVSAKASDPLSTIAAYRLIAERTDCPLHIGLTEAGTLVPGAVRSAAALGVLLGEGIGDTVRVSLTDSPEREVRVGAEILRALGLRAPGPAVVSCPTCGRTKVDVARVATALEEELEKAWLSRGRGGGRFPKVAVMGCAVNGPGEAKGADVALCGGDGCFLLYTGGRLAGRVPVEDAIPEVMKHVLHS